MTDSTLTKLWRKFRRSDPGSEEEFRVLEALNAELGLGGGVEAPVKQTKTILACRETSKRCHGEGEAKIDNREEV